MRELIIKKLKQIEKSNNIRILLAVESGSRAWGFASSDSDYDVRFIYVRPKEEYLRLDELRDVIELPINAVLDINGWDLKKALQLLHRSNPTLFEWFSSPIIYMETEYAQNLRRKILSYFSSLKSLYHYINMAERSCCEYLKASNVRAKKYFYALRPVLACNWIIERKTTPPMLFKELVEAQLPEKLRCVVENLLELKMKSTELKEIPRIQALNDYLDEEITNIKSKLNHIKESNDNDFDELNKIFLSAFDTI